jgi:5-methylcytosine-specific restriction endonuclease McrA
MLVDQSAEVASAIRQAFGWGTLNCDGGLRANFCCEYCRLNLLTCVDSYHSWQIDHIIPMGSGGTNELGNVALSCRTCNHLKHTYVPSGATREEQINDAARYIAALRQKKQVELDKLRVIVGLSVCGDGG